MTWPTSARSSPASARCSAAPGSVMGSGSRVRAGELRPGPAAGVEFRSVSPHRSPRVPPRRSPMPCAWPRPGSTAPRPARGHHQGGRLDARRLDRQHPGHLEAAVRPGGQQISTMWASALPEEAKSMAGPLLSMISQMGGMAFGSQLGQALGRLSSEVLTSTDIGSAAGPQGRGRADAGGRRGASPPGSSNRAPRS